MQKYQIPWGQWYEQSTRTLTFPDDWDVRYCAMQHLETLTKEQILDKLDHPIGSDTLETLAANKKSACIIIDDISRPTPGALLLPMIIKKLVDAGMDDSQIKVLIALGGHRPMTRQEMTIKVGSWVIEHVMVLNHSPFSADLVTVPDDRQVIKINKHFMDADLRIAVGCIVPHTLAQRRSSPGSAASRPCIPTTPLCLRTRIPACPSRPAPATPITPCARTWSRSWARWGWTSSSTWC